MDCGGMQMSKAGDVGKKGVVDEEAGLTVVRDFRGTRTAEDVIRDLIDAHNQTEKAADRAPRGDRTQRFRPD